MKTFLSLSLLVLLSGCYPVLGSPDKIKSIRVGEATYALIETRSGHKFFVPKEMAKEFKVGEVYALSLNIVETPE